MEGINGGGRVGVGVEGNGDDMDDGMQFCSIHPYRNNNNHGGICAFCLQEKLDKLVSSSFPSPLHASSSSSSPSFRSDTGGGGGDAVDKKISVASASDHQHHGADGIVFKRSKSTVAPRGSKFLDGFWSFLYLSSKSKKQDSKVGSITAPSPTTTTVAVVDAAAAAKVSRSRSVGCGSRSFSGDLFERISTGFGDCTLRRVESQRESKPKAVTSSSMKEQVKCGGIFGGFMITTSSSYCVSSATEDHINGKPTTTGHGRSKSWGWTFASPMRAFTKPSSNKKHIINSNTTPNLSAIPSLLTVTS
ncbi:hypothetical protein V6N13_060841 [Hibiscus sabdariffa]|uniref:Uncharacterized protein n=1 Tax=Hibiscus sabdariffa TaxID=183260 RepID=A0ABR2P737_9ROSI